MTTQFVATAPADAEISVTAEILAPGRRTNQVRVTGTDDTGTAMFASLGATGQYRDDGLAGVFENPPSWTDPRSPSPGPAPSWAWPARPGWSDLLPELPSGIGFSSVIEYREPAVRSHPDPGPGGSARWARRRDRRALTPAAVAFIADMVPLSIADALEVVAGGISLDNSIRIGAFEQTEWVLVDLRPHLAVGDYGHGAAHIWSENGTLLATASQSASMLRFDLSDLPVGEADLS